MRALITAQGSARGCTTQARSGIPEAEKWPSAQSCEVLQSGHEFNGRGICAMVADRFSTTGWRGAHGWLYKEL